MLALPPTQYDTFRDELVREVAQPGKNVRNVVLTRCAVGAAQELKQTQPGAPPVGVEGVVGGELAVGGFWRGEGTVGRIGVEEVGAGGGRVGEGGED